MQNILENIESSSDDDEQDDEENDMLDTFSSEAQITQVRLPSWKALLLRVSQYMNVDAQSIAPASS